MRVTAEARELTRQRILDVSSELFRSQGFQESTSRDIARAAGIANGTLFNYFPNKESIALQLACDVLEDTEAAFRKRRRSTASLEEDLFLYVSTGLRRLQPVRAFIGPALETHLGPAIADDACQQGATIRLGHIEVVGRLLTEHGFTEPPNSVQFQMYWLLYTGVLAFWTKDASVKQEDTLALLDQSMKMFVAWLTAQATSESDSNIENSVES